MPKVYRDEDWVRFKTTTKESSTSGRSGKVGSNGRKKSGILDSSATSKSISRPWYGRETTRRSSTSGNSGRVSMQHWDQEEWK